MGRALKPPDEHNRAGYFEDLEVTRMHEAWLAARSLTLASVDDRFPLETTREEADLVTSYIGGREAEARPWGLKAPGILFFWPTWRDRLPEGTVLLLPFRNPDAVIRSFKRYGLAPDNAASLWLQLNRLALDAVDTSPFEACILDFDDRNQLARAINSVLGAYVETYEPRLVHHPSGALPADPELRSLYAELRRRAAG